MTTLTGIKPSDLFQETSDPTCKRTRAFAAQALARRLKAIGVA